MIAYCDKMMIEIAGSTLTNTNIIVENNDVVIEGFCNYTDAESRPSKLCYCDIYHFENQEILSISSYCIDMKL